jgi:isoquinoline 1-oxidoreductase beta subunit
MNAILNLSRRTLLRSAGLVLAAQTVPGGLLRFAHAASGEASFAPNVFVAIAGDGTVTIYAHRSEMGQGVRTSLPMILADELEADWARVKVAQADGDAIYGDQYTDGSRSVVKNFQRMREFGATARTLLEQAAAEKWGVDAADCAARNHQVVRLSTGETFEFGELVEVAAALPVPAVETVRLKDPKEFRYIGKGARSVDLPDMMVGAAKYTIDIALPDMRYASIERCPVVLGKVVSYDATETLAVPGVERVVEIAAPEKPVIFKPLGGIAVVATNSWAAMEGRRKLKIEWDLGENAAYDTDLARKEMETTAAQPGDPIRSNGDVATTLAAAGRTVEATYYTPHFVHAPMEPPGAVADYRDGKIEIWSSTQDGQAARSLVAEVLGLDEANVTSHVPLLGGAFGRKSKPDFAAEAALISREIGMPVKVTWMREDDIRHGFYHSSSVQHVKAAVDENGRTTAWLHRSVFPPITSIFVADAAKPDGWELDFGLTDLPYDIPNIAIENGAAPAHVRIGWMRSVQNVFHAFAIGSFADELAHEAGQDPKEHLLALIGAPRFVDLKAGGVESYFNYDNTTDLYPIDTGRLANVVQLVAEKSGWGRQLPRGQGLGIAAHRAFLTYVATVVEVNVAQDGTVTIPRVDMAVDAGTVINPDRVRAQMEGAIIYAMSSACYSEITAKDGRIQQGNFDDYQVARITDAPREVNIHLVESTAPPGGVGEPGVPPFAPALCNAIFAATGKRVRSLPLANHDLSWT